MKTLHKFFLLSLILFLSLCAVSASDVNDTQSSITDTSLETPQASNYDNNYEVNDYTYEETEEDEVVEEDCCTQPCTTRTYNNNTTITPENYKDKIDTIYDYDAAIFDGTFNSSVTGGSLNITGPVILTSISGATFEDMQFIISSDNVTIRNLIIENDDGTNGSVILSDGYNNTEVLNNTITVNKTTAGETVAIKFNSTNNQTICRNNITMNILPQYRWEIIYHAAEGDTPEYYEYIFHLYNAAIVVDNSYDVKVRNNKINSSAATTTEFYGTNEGINIRNSNYTNVTCNNITITGGDYAYGITFENVLYSNITNNKVNSTTDNYANAIQIVESKNNRISYNNLTATARNTTTPHNYEAVAYGIYMSTNWGTSNNYNNIVSYNNINVDGSVSYGIEGYIISDCLITYNNITATGNVSMGIGLYSSTGINITYNNINVTGATKDISTGFYEMITPETTGIKTVGNQNSVGSTIENNNITVTDTVISTDYAVILNDDNNTVQFNSLTADTNTGISAVQDSGNNNYIA